MHRVSVLMVISLFQTVALPTLVFARRASMVGIVRTAK